MSTTTPHPWRGLRRLTHVTLVWAHLDGCLGESDGRCLIRMDPRQYQTQRRCTLAHELEHLRRGHTGPVTAAEERRVRQAVARYLVPLDALVDALLWSLDEHDLADELFVDVQVVQDRLAGLADGEKGEIKQAIAAREGAA